MSEEGRSKKNKYPWNVWEPESTLTGALGIDSAVESFLEEGARDEEKKRQKDLQLVEAMMLMKRNAIEDQMREERRELSGFRQRVREEEYDRRVRQLQQEEAKRIADIERPKKAVSGFWDLMNNGIQLLSHSTPNIGNAMSEFNKASQLLANEIQFLVPETESYRMMINDLKNLADVYAMICEGLLEFSRNGDYATTFRNVLLQLQHAQRAMQGMYISVKKICEAFLEDGQRRDTNFRIAMDSVPTDADAGAVILVLMALILNSKVKKYDDLIDELYQKLGMQ